MKAAEIRDLRSEDLLEKLEKLEKQLFELHSQAVTESIQNTMAGRHIKRDIARIKTIMREQELKGQ